ncbi:MAG TPA: glycosyltransferase [Candidatus Nitrosopolaris sp.]|nr:glycosyltransferase [Candidatus Nitrosopolaris sp.]
MSNKQALVDFESTNSKPRIVIVCDWLIGGGAERVVEQLHKMYPEAPIYASYCTNEWRQKLDGKVITGYLQHWPFSRLRKFLPPLRALWFSHLNFDGYDLVISSSGAEAKGIKTQRKTENGKRQTIHICYCHAPTHYYWSRYDDYLKNPGFGFFDPLARLGLRMLVGPMRRWDYKAAQRPDYLLANSTYTKEQIKKYYGRDSVVVHPPVDIERFASKAEEPRRGFITAGRQTPYKRIDLAVAACTKLNLPLVVLGSGPEHRRLKAMAGKTITFLRGKSDEEVARYFQTSLAFIFPGVDDFGIVAVEALAAGTPVIAYKAGGALDYIQPGKTGEFFNEPDAKSLSTVLQKFNPEKYNHTQIQKSADQFSAANFRSNFQQFVKKCLSNL